MHLETPIGPLTVTATKKAVTAIRFGTEVPEGFTPGERPEGGFGERMPGSTGSPNGESTATFSIREGEFVTVKIDGCLDGDLSGYIVEE